MAIDANTVSGAVNRQSILLNFSHLEVYEKVGDPMPKYTINLERCDLMRVSMSVAYLDCGH